MGHDFVTRDKPVPAPAVPAVPTVPITTTRPHPCPTLAFVYKHQRERIFCVCNFVCTQALGHRVVANGPPSRRRDNDDDAVVLSLSLSHPPRPHLPRDNVMTRCDDNNDGERRQRRHDDANDDNDAVVLSLSLPVLPYLGTMRQRDVTATTTTTTRRRDDANDDNDANDDDDAVVLSLSLPLSPCPHIPRNDTTTRQQQQQQRCCRPPPPPLSSPVPRRHNSADAVTVTVVLSLSPLMRCPRPSR